MWIMVVFTLTSSGSVTNLPGYPLNTEVASEEACIDTVAKIAGKVKEKVQWYCIPPNTTE